mmetsp:Transcript_32193/g.37830  ORF Transcript_32193/g.37830 Transcript_32193/m.37830 type:complete len:148 (+) Transcript_32193:66-509(+)
MPPKRKASIDVSDSGKRRSLVPSPDSKNEAPKQEQVITESDEANVDVQTLPKALGNNILRSTDAVPSGSEARIPVLREVFTDSPESGVERNTHSSKHELLNPTFTLLILVFWMMMLIVILGFGVKLAVQTTSVSNVVSHLMFLSGSQ